VGGGLSSESQWWLAAGEESTHGPGGDGSSGKKASRRRSGAGISDRKRSTEGQRGSCPSKEVRKEAGTGRELFSFGRRGGGQSEQKKEKGRVSLLRAIRTIPAGSSDRWKSREVKGDWVDSYANTPKKPNGKRKKGNVSS